MGFGWRPPSQGEDMAGKDQKSGGKKEEMHVITNAQGAVRTITVEDWKKNEAALLAEGFSRPNTMPKEDK